MGILQKKQKINAYKYKKGSFTVEAAVIMGISLLAIGLILFLCAFVHGRACLTAMAYEQAYTERKPTSVALFGITDIQKSEFAGEDENQITVNGKCVAAWGGFERDIQAEAKVKKTKPVTFIRKMQAVFRED